MIERGGTALQRFLLGEQVIISRALCHFEPAAAPRARSDFRALQAVELAKTARTPYRNPAYHLDWGEGSVGVWSWPADLTDKLDGFEGRAAPETVLKDRGDGPRLVRCLDGFEGQVFENGELVASRWWPLQPDETQWRSFVRGARGDIDAGSPAPITLDMAAAARPAPLLQRLDGLRRSGWRDIAALAVVAFLAPGLFLAGQAVHLCLQARSLSSELEVLREDAAELSAARSAAQQSIATLQTYSAAIDTPHPAFLLAEFIDVITQFEADLSEFEVRDGRLTAAISTPSGFQPAPLVQALENGTLFSELRIEPGRGVDQWSIQGRFE